MLLQANNFNTKNAGECLRFFIVVYFGDFLHSMYKNRYGGETMENIYRDIATRTDGDIYLGIVGPVRTGKSTFIKRFMDTLVLPNIEDSYKRQRATDELPQSAGGKTIMTTEPKFIPNEAVEIALNDGLNCKVRLIDCVGYVVKGATGHLEDGQERMVNTPWEDEPVPFVQAAEIGTRKVIEEHSTIGLVVTTDGSISEIPRQDYIEAEERVIRELKAIHKPFIILLNSINPSSDSVQSLAQDLSEKYGVSVVPVNCSTLGEQDISKIMENVLKEFPISEIKIRFPAWVDGLNSTHWLCKSLMDGVKQSLDSVKCVREIKYLTQGLAQNEWVERAEVQSMNLGCGAADITVLVPDSLFYKVLGESSGFEINGQADLVSLMCSLSAMKKEYDKIAGALQEVKQKGYGIVTPSLEELRLEEPEIIKQGGRFGVRLRASAPSIHMVQATVETEVSPIVGTEKQSEELVHYLLEEFDSEPTKIWESNIFGKTLHELVNEGLHNKLSHMPDDAQMKLQETLQRIINEGSGGLICIIL